MKILQLIQKRQLRGAEIFASQLSVELKKRGHQVDMVYLFGSANSDLDYDLNYLPLRAVINKRFWDFGAYKRLAGLIKEGKYDIVQANAGDTLKYAAISKKIYRWRVPLIYRNANKMSNFIRSNTHKWFNSLFLNEVDYIISVSENCRKDIMKLYPKFSSITTTGTIGTYKFDGISAYKSNIPGPVWINVGSFVPEKNHGFLIDIFHTYLQKHNKGQLFLVGDGKLRDDLERKAKTLGLQHHITFFGYRKDVISLIKSADIMVMPSKIEGLPGVILEALACGKPVIAAGVGGIPEVVRDSFNGFCIRHYHVNDYMVKIEQILEDRDLYNKMSWNGQCMVDNDYLMPAIATRFENIYLPFVAD